MKQAVIDIGSNSIRLTLYKTNGMHFKILFREKIMAGLAGYVERGALSGEGMSIACNALMEFRQTLEALGIQQAAVFATASLRNISNTEDALAKIEKDTGFSIEVLSGEEEAILGYVGAMQELELSDGVFTDIGGASTELVLFEKGEICDSASFPIGSLSLYRSCVKKILPGEGALHRMENLLNEVFDENEKLFARPCRSLVGVGGTARAVLKLCGKYFGLPEGCQRVTKEQFFTLCEVLCRGDKQAVDLILKHEADRIHTLIPGLMILKNMITRLGAEEIIVSKYGAREGYLCRKLLAGNIQGEI